MLMMLAYGAHVRRTPRPDFGSILGPLIFGNSISRSGAGFDIRALENFTCLYHVKAVCRSRGGHLNKHKEEQAEEEEQKTKTMTKKKKKMMMMNKKKKKQACV